MQTCSIGNRIARSGARVTHINSGVGGLLAAYMFKHFVQAGMQLYHYFGWRRSVARFEYAQTQQGVNNEGYGKGGENLNGDEGDQDIV